MLVGINAVKDRLLGRKAKSKSKPKPRTAADLEAAAGLLVDEVAMAPPLKKSASKKKHKKKREKETRKLEEAVELTAAAATQRKAELQHDAKAKTQKVQAQVEQVTAIIHDNMNKILERGEKVEDLTDKTERLKDASMGFKKEANNLKRELEVKNLRLTFILIGLVVGLLFGGYFCVFWGIFNKLAIPIIALSTGIGGGAGFLLSMITETLYNLFKDSPLMSTSHKSKAKLAEAALNKATPDISYEAVLTGEQENSLRSLFEEKPTFVLRNPSAPQNTIKEEPEKDRMSGLTLR